MSIGKTLQNADESFRNLNVSRHLVSPNITAVNINSPNINSKTISTEELILNGVPFNPTPTPSSVGNSIVLVQNFSAVSFNAPLGSSLSFTPQGVNPTSSFVTPIIPDGDYINSEFIDNTNPSNWIVLKDGIYLFELNTSVTLTSGPLTQDLTADFKKNTSDFVISRTGTLNSTISSVPSPIPTCASLSGSYVLPCTSGDTIVFRVYNNVSQYINLPYVSIKITCLQDLTL
jgi:hypothetical protein